MALPGQAIALGTIVQADFTGVDPTLTPVYLTLGLIKGLTPPPREGSEADGNVLSDDLSQFISGIEVNPIFEFTQYWHPGEAEQQFIDNHFNNRRKPAGIGGGVLTIRLIYPHDGIEPTDVAPTEAFLGNVLNIGKETLDEPNSVYMRTVVIRRTGPILKATFTIP